ncbi:MAG TPA: alkaline phosphatase family protein, partial [Polyangiaceae bacterium]
MRRSTHALRAVALPAVLGALWVLGVLASASAQPVVPPDEAMLGTSAAEVANRVAVRFAGDIRHVKLELAAVGAGFGVMLGLGAAALLAVRRRLRARDAPEPAWRVGAEALALVVAFHAGCVAWWMARYPQIYAASFWRHEGARRSLEALVTDRLHPTGVLVVAGVGLAAWLLGSPRAWRVRLARGVDVVRRRWPLGVAAATLAAALALLCSPPGARAARASVEDPRPNLVILASDGLRADRLRPEVMPRLDALAARGTRFEHAYTAIPRTFPSWVTLLTGRYPSHHRVRSNFPRWEETSRALDDLPRAFARTGWATAVVSDYAGEVFSRMDLGFDVRRTPDAGFVPMIRQKALGQALPVLPVLESRLGRRILPDVAGMDTPTDPAILADDAVRTMRSLEGRPFVLVVFFST